MKSRSDSGLRQKELAIIGIKASAYYSHADGVWVTLVRCGCCACAYSELLETAIATVVADGKHQCIVCDEASEVKTGRVTIAGIIASQ